MGSFSGRFFVRSIKSFDWSFISSPKSSSLFLNLLLRNCQGNTSFFQLYMTISGLSLRLDRSSSCWLVQHPSLKKDSESRSIGRMTKRQHDSRRAGMTKYVVLLMNSLVIMFLDFLNNIDFHTILQYKYYFARLNASCSVLTAFSISLTSITQETFISEVLIIIILMPSFARVSNILAATPK